MSKLQCPNCKGMVMISTEKRINGYSTCGNCGYRHMTARFERTDGKPYEHVKDKPKDRLVLVQGDDEVFSAVPPHIARMYEEASELTDRIIKLDKFIDEVANGTTDKLMPNESIAHHSEFIRLSEQSKAMKEYLSVLQMRIALAPTLDN